MFKAEAIYAPLFYLHGEEMAEFGIRLWAGDGRRGSALRAVPDKRISSDGKPCSGVRGGQRASTESRGRSAPCGSIPGRETLQGFSLSFLKKEFFS